MARKLRQLQQLQELELAAREKQAEKEEREHMRQMILDAERRRKQEEQDLQKRMVRAASPQGQCIPSGGTHTHAASLLLASLSGRGAAAS